MSASTKSSSNGDLRRTLIVRLGLALAHHLRGTNPNRALTVFDHLPYCESLEIEKVGVRCGVAIRLRQKDIVEESVSLIESSPSGNEDEELWKQCRLETFRSWLCWIDGDIEGGLIRARVFLKHARAVDGADTSVISALMNVGVMQLELGHFTGSLETFREARKVAKLHGDKRANASSTAHLADIHYNFGNYQEALALVNEAIEGMRIVGQFGRLASMHSLRSLILAESGRHQEARDSIQHALELDKRGGLDFHTTARRGIHATLNVHGIYQLLVKDSRTQSDESESSILRTNLQDLEHSLKEMQPNNEIPSPRHLAGRALAHALLAEHGPARILADQVLTNPDKILDSEKLRPFTRELLDATHDILGHSSAT